MFHKTSEEGAMVFAKQEHLYIYRCLARSLGETFSASYTNMAGFLSDWNNSNTLKKYAKQTCILFYLYNLFCRNNLNGLEGWSIMKDLAENNLFK